MCFFIISLSFFGVGNENHLFEGRGQKIERKKQSNQKIKGDLFLEFSLSSLSYLLNDFSLQCTNK